MLKDNSNILRCYGALDMQSVGEIVEPDYPSNDTIEGQILREIYSPNEDGMMEGDIAKFLSNKVRPELKEFILNNLLQSHSPVRSQLPTDGLTDDEIIALSPSVYDSFDSYSSRVRDYLNTQFHENNENS